MKPFKEGPYRRRIRLVAVSEDAVDGELEDDFHHFGVLLGHDGQRVVAVDGRAIRWPWTTCPDAVGPLHALEGMPLSRRCTAIASHTEPRANCTHLFDLAGLCVTHAARGDGSTRVYDAEIPRPVDGKSRVRLWRDGELLLDWHLVDGCVVDAPPYSDVPWGGGFMRWADETLDPDTAEAAIVLRRACTIGSGRGMDLDRIDRASELEQIMAGVCFTMRPPQIRVALRNKDSMRDFAADPDRLLAGD